MTVTNITQTGSKELNAQTQLQISMLTHSSIPAGSTLTIILPSNFQFTNTVSVVLNNRAATDAKINSKTFTLTLTVLPD